MKHRTPRAGWRRLIPPMPPRPAFLPTVPRWARRTLLVLGLTVVVGAAGTTVVAYAFDRVVASDQILPGVTVAGVNVGGMGPYRAIAAVHKKLDPALNRSL